MVALPHSDNRRVRYYYYGSTASVRMLCSLWTRRNSGLVVTFALAHSRTAHTFAPRPLSSSRLYSSSTSLLMSSNKKVLVPIADGSEEIETTCITDTLTRFGADVTIASVMEDTICVMSRGLKVQADCVIQDAGDQFDLVALPGGMPGAEHLRDSQVLTSLLEKQKAAGKLYGAICAGTYVAMRTGCCSRRSSNAL